MIQKFKLRGILLKNLRTGIMLGYANWILEAIWGEINWLNPNTNGKGGVGVILTSKYTTRLISAHGALYDNWAIWVRIEGIEGGNIGLVCVNVPKFPIEWQHLWHIMTNSLFRRGGDFNMTAWPCDKFNYCGRVTSDLERFSWNESSMLSKFMTLSFIKGDIVHGIIGNFDVHKGL